MHKKYSIIFFECWSSSFISCEFYILLVNHPSYLLIHDYFLFGNSRIYILSHTFYDTMLSGYFHFGNHHLYIALLIGHVILSLAGIGLQLLLNKLSCHSVLVVIHPDKVVTIPK